MNFYQIAASLIFIVPCFFTLYVTFSDRLKVPSFATAGIAILLYLVIAMAGTYVYFSVPVTPLTSMILSLSSIISALFILTAASYYSPAQALFALGIMKCYADDVHLFGFVICVALKGSVPSIPGGLELAVSLGVTLITLPLICLFFRKLLRPALDRTEHLSFWRLLWVMPVCNILLYDLTIAPSFNSQSPVPSDSFRVYMIPFIWVLLSFSTYIIILKMISETTKNVRLEEELHISETQITAQQKQTEMLQQRIEETRRIRHDQRHHVIALQGYVANKDLGGIEVYLKEYLSALDSCSIETYCDNMVINAIVNHFIDMARAEDIDMSVSIRLEEPFPFPDADTCIILCNILENAVEACQRQTSGKRFITFNMFMASSCLLAIIAENSYNGQLYQKDGEFLSSKQKGRKGIGLASVLNIVKKYNGIPKFQYDKQTFTISLLLNANDEQDAAGE